MHYNAAKPPPAPSVAALTTAHGAALLALTKQCIASVSDAATPPASVAPLLECALLCVRAVFKLRARLTCPPLSLEAFLRRILVDAYSKRMVRAIASVVGDSISCSEFPNFCRYFLQVRSVC